MTFQDYIIITALLFLAVSAIKSRQKQCSSGCSACPQRSHCSDKKQGRKES